MQGTSTDGYSGFKDKVNNHYFRIFGSALLLSSITAGISLADKSDGHETETAADKAMSAAINQIGQVATEMIRKNMNIDPTLEILSLIHISEPTRPCGTSRMPSSA